MKLEDLQNLKNSKDAPSNIDEYTVWLHNKILETINYEIWEFRETKSNESKNSYDACTHVKSLPSLQLIK